MAATRGLMQGRSRGNANSTQIGERGAYYPLRTNTCAGMYHVDNNKQCQENRKINTMDVSSLKYGHSQ